LQPLGRQPVVDVAGVQQRDQDAGVKQGAHGSPSNVN
jgi:hypothetical protein